MSDLQMGGIKITEDDLEYVKALRAFSQYAIDTEAYFARGYEQGKADVLERLGKSLRLVEGVANGKGDPSEEQGMYEAVEIIREQMEGV